MPTYQNAAYHDPNIGIAFNNLAQMFAPPDAADTANYALAKGRTQQNEIIAKLAADPKYAGFDRQAILADLFDPTNSFYAQNQNNATARRGQDITAATSTSNNLADNQFGVLGKMYGPLGQGDVRPEMPATIASQFGLPAMPQVAGAPKPLSETEVRGNLLAGAPKLSDQQLVALTMGSTPTENIVGPDGKPQVAYQAAAVGQEPYFNKGAEAKPENGVAQMPDGSNVPAVQGPDNAWYNAQTGAKLPDTIQIFKVPSPQGSASDVGLGKPAQNFIDQSLIDIAIAKDTASKLRDLIKTAPASQGAVGWLRGTAQNVVETGGELGNFFGGEVKKITDEIKQGAADADLAGAFDAKIPAIDMMANLLAFQYAKTTTGQRLSNEMLKAAKSALGLDGLDANQANSLARLDQAIQQISSQEEILKKAKSQGVNSLSAPTADAAVAADVPPGWDPEDWKYLTDDEKAQALNGG